MQRSDFASDPRDQPKPKPVDDPSRKAPVSEPEHVHDHEPEIDPEGSEVDNPEREAHLPD